MIAAAAVFGLSITEVGVILVGLGYMVSLVKDWRPVRSLRAENRDLRQMLEQAEKKILGLQVEVRNLQKATNLSVLQDEHKKIAEVLERVVANLDKLDGAVRANTAAVETVARGSALKQAIEDMNPTP